MDRLVWICMFLVLIGATHDGHAVSHGSLAEVGQFNYMAYVKVGSQRCSGSIISTYHILTVAHCAACAKAQKSRVYVGGVDEEAGNMLKYQVETIHIPPDYQRPEAAGCSFLCIRAPRVMPDPETQRVNDIAVLTLKTEMTFGPNIGKLIIPSDNWLPECDLLDFAGWGRSEDPDQVLGRLRHGKIALFPPELYGRFRITPKTNCIFASFPNNETHVAGGDSGSPVVWRGELYGVLIQGHCRPGSIDTYLRVYDYLDFIRTAMMDKIPEPF